MREERHSSFKYRVLDKARHHIFSRPCLKQTIPPFHAASVEVGGSVDLHRTWACTQCPVAMRNARLDPGGVDRT